MALEKLKLKIWQIGEQLKKRKKLKFLVFEFVNGATGHTNDLLMSKSSFDTVTLFIWATQSLLKHNSSE